MQLRQPGFTYSVYGPFTKNKERIQNFKETGHTHFYQNELDKACFKHHATDQDFKDLNRRIASDKILGDKELYKVLLKAPKNHVYQRDVASMAHKLFDKKTSVGADSLANKYC